MPKPPLSSSSDGHCIIRQRADNCVCPLRLGFRPFVRLSAGISRPCLKIRMAMPCGGSGSGTHGAENARWRNSGLWGRPARCRPRIRAAGDRFFFPPCPRIRRRRGEPLHYLEVTRCRIPRPQAPPRQPQSTSSGFRRGLSLPKIRVRGGTSWKCAPTSPATCWRASSGRRNSPPTATWRRRRCPARRSTPPCLRHTPEAPFSVVFTGWLSMTAPLGVEGRPREGRASGSRAS